MSRSRARGTAYESAVVAFFREHGWPYAERRALGGSRDRGDLAGIPGLVAEMKNCKEICLGEWATETEKERRNDGARIGALIIKRRNRPVADSYVVVPLSQFVALIADDDPPIEAVS